MAENDAAPPEQPAAAGPPANYLARVRESCTSLQAAQVQVDTAKVAEFVRSADPAAIRAAGESLATDGPTSFPEITFSSQDQEVSFIALTHALDFGSGFRSPLHAFHGLGAWNTIRPGMVRLWRACPDLDAAFLTSIRRAQTVEYFLPGLLDLAEEDALRQALLPLADALCKCCNEVGAGLEARGFKHLHELVYAAIERDGSAAEGIVRALVTAFPCTFNDVHEYEGSQVFLYKKAQLVTGELLHRFRAADPRFAFADAAELTAYCDNVIVATMRKTGCIRCSDELNARIDAGTPLPSGGGDEVALRAKALAAVESIASQIGVPACEVGNYLWATLGKEPSFRAFKRHATPDTVFY